MSSERLPPAQIEAIKRRVEEALEDLEGAHFAYETWMTEWRIRQAEQRLAADKARALAGTDGA